MEIAEIVAELEKSRAGAAKLDVPRARGVYAIFLREAATLPLDNIRPNGLIYIGSSKDLAGRHLDNHFKSGGSRFSTLRRSIGALLNDELQLVAIPRGGPKDRLRFTNYCFTSDGEERLTAWMIENLEVGVCPLDIDPKAIEAQLILELTPLLCLTKWANPLARYIKELRKTCADQARRARN